jgi:hypothetical protein
MDKFIDLNDLPKLNQEDKNNVNKHVTSNEINNGQAHC